MEDFASGFDLVGEGEADGRGPTSCASLRPLRRLSVRLAEGGNATSANLKKVRKALGLLQTDPRYPGLHSHLYQHFPGLEKGKVWDSYVENRTSGAWRIYWMYGPNEVRDGGEIAIITVLVIGPHL